MRPLVVALAGTDHHPFERLVQWVDAAALRLPDVRFLVQHGSGTRPPRVAEGTPYLSHEALVALLGDAAVAICHGGPGTIMDAREAGHVPLCVPRDPALGEHVDQHQKRFAAVVGREGVVRHVTSETSFHTELDRALAQGSAPVRALRLVTARDTARARVAAELDEVLLLGARPANRGR